MTSLYLCYQSLLDPLTQTQVVAYLEGLAEGGYRVVLLTFEPERLSREETQAWRQRMAAKGIAWHWRRYHKRPSVPATAYDILVGALVGLWLARRYGVTLLHARTHVPGLMALFIRRLTSAKLLFDLRGFMAEEYADAGVWPNGGTLFRATERVERLLVRSADGIVVLTEKAREMLLRWYPAELGDKPVHVIPCCVDLRNIPRRPVEAEPTHARNGMAFVYVGKLGGWYLVEAMVAFVAEARRLVPGVSWAVWTQSRTESLRRLVSDSGLDDGVGIGRTSPEALSHELFKADAALCFIKPCLSKMASSPTKLAEYLAAGLPVVSTAGVGDVDSVLGETGAGRKAVGVLVGELSEPGYRRAFGELRALLDDPGTPDRCRAVAEEHFHLERVGWARYRRMYQALLSGEGGSS